MENPLQDAGIWFFLTAWHIRLLHLSVTSGQSAIFQNQKALGSISGRNILMWNSDNPLFMTLEKL